MERRQSIAPVLIDGFATNLEMLYEHDYKNIKLAFQYRILEYDFNQLTNN